LFQERLELEATRDYGLAFLRETHAKYLPDPLAQEPDVEPENDGKS
jgi:hypothetical protein